MYVGRAKASGDEGRQQQGSNGQVTVPMDHEQVAYLTHLQLR